MEQFRGSCAASEPIFPHHDARLRDPQCPLHVDIVEASVAGLELNPISVSFFHHAPARRVLNKILEPRNAVTITVHSMLIPIDL
jgi:hypothetical protein